MSQNSILSFDFPPPQSFKHTRLILSIQAIQKQAEAGAGSVGRALLILASPHLSSAVACLTSTALESQQARLVRLPLVYLLLFFLHPLPTPELPEDYLLPGRRV